MPISDTDRASLIDILVTRVPAPTVVEVVREQKVMTDFDFVRKQAPEDPTEARRFIAQRIVTSYENEGRLRQFVQALYRHSYLDDLVGPLLARLISLQGPTEELTEAQQAAIAKRANTMASRPLREFLAANESRICIVVAELTTPVDDGRVRLGTGFLVGPDLVLTAYHTLRYHITDNAPRMPAPGECYAIFDFYEGGPLQDPVVLPPELIKIPFAADNWLVAANEDMPKDGLFLEPNAEQSQLLRARLDFALVRLAEPVGKQTRRSTGGARRSWIKLPRSAVALAQDDRIIIPQHPHGYPQRIDFGRYSARDSELDTSATRLRYDTETDQGTSGAPCFNQSFALVGMHNAAFSPEGIDVKKNQAIRLDRILTALAAVPGLAEEVEAEPVRLWNTSPTRVPRVILGRDTLLKWLADAAMEDSRSAAERVYAAHVATRDTPHTGYGKSFTIEVVNAARRGTAEPIVVLGSKDNLLPDNVSDLLRAIGYQLGMDKSVFDSMPPRPASNLPAGAPNADKLRKWASEDVPAWFDARLREYREQVVDLQVEARKRIDALKSLNIPPTREDLAILKQPAGQTDTLRRWPLAWIAIETPVSTRISEEVRDLLAGMIGGKAAEAAMPQELRRLRWLFIGYVPDFLSADRVTRELLDPMAITGASVVEGIARYRDSMASDLPEVEREWLQDAIDTFLQEGLAADAVQDPTRRLATLQQRFFPYLFKKAEERRKKPQ